MWRTLALISPLLATLANVGSADLVDKTEVVADAAPLKVTSAVQADALRLDEVEELLATYELPLKSKTTLALINMLGLGVWGCDRCYLGNYWLGTAKGITLGGFIIVSLIDYFIILLNLLEKASSINTFGLQASFKKQDLETSYWIALVLLAASVLQQLLRSCGKSEAREQTAEEEQPAGDYLKLTA
eukprot:TRINITY_DN2251_c0_g1_i1.p1 TRINITY_DN2251_c0_g1~~TRINITY_DN2251_c0_g1_i1.p1  ORF type:complete len:187 (+),score=68.65 TRINITY_DN2251_c0_g1_i1:152-712(+)